MNKPMLFSTVVITVMVLFSLPPSLPTSFFYLSRCPSGGRGTLTRIGRWWSWKELLSDWPEQWSKFRVPNQLTVARISTLQNRWLMSTLLILQIQHNMTLSSAGEFETWDCWMILTRSTRGSSEEKEKN